MTLHIENIKAVSEALKISVAELMTIINSFGFGSKFISFLYSSNATEQTELSQYVCNANVSYERALNKDIETLKSFDVSSIDLSKIPFYRLNLKGKNEAQFTQLVNEALPIALNELIEAKTKSGNKTPEQIANEQKDKGILNLTSNGILKFNLNTMNFLIHAQKVNKTVKVQSEVQKLVASSPKTVAKELIQKQSKLKTLNYRTFIWGTENIVRAKFQGLEVMPK